MFPPRDLRTWLGACLVLAGASCARFQVQPVALYAGPARADDQVAFLHGPAEKVDDREVARRGTAFTLLPGCHVVELKTTYAEGTTDGAWSASIPRTRYALRMRAGFVYEIDVRRMAGAGGLGIVSVVGNSGARGSLKLTAVERDSRGRVTAALTPIPDDAEISVCRAWAAALTPS